MALPANHLIIVCGHAIWLGGQRHGQDESEWLVEGYKTGETPLFIEHIQTGLINLRADNRAVLVFSGGLTRKETILSEGESYRNLAQANEYFNYFGNNASRFPTDRILVEDRALDSYHNILLSIILFARVHHALPERLTVVSHAFKIPRLSDHCEVLGYPSGSVTFDGSAVPRWMAGAGMAEPVWDGIREAREQWAADPYGAGEALAAKRRARNAWGTDVKLFVDATEMMFFGVQTRFLRDGSEVLAQGSMLNLPGT